MKILALLWKDTGGRYECATAGHLYCYIEHYEAYKEPGHPDHELESFAWFIAPDDEDKNYRRALREGHADTRDDARAAVCEALMEIVRDVLRDVGAATEDTGSSAS